MSKSQDQSIINPAIADVWLVARVVWGTLGINLGLALYTFSPFIYTKFEGVVGSGALRYTVWSAILFQACLLLSDVPTGAVADYLGRKRAIVISFALAALAFFIRSWICFASSLPSILILVLLEAVVYGFSYTFYSGSFVSWMVDTVRERNIPEGHGPLMARSWIYMFAGQMIGAALGLWLYLSGYIFVAFLLGCNISILCTVFCAIVMKESVSLNFYQGPLSFRSSAERLKKIIATGLKISVQVPPIAYLMMTYACAMFFNSVVNYLWPVVMQSNFGAGKMTPFWFLMVFASLLVSMGASRFFGKLSHGASSEKLWFSLMSAFLIMGGLILLLGVASYGRGVPFVLFIVVIPLFQLGYGFMGPAYNTLLNNYIPTAYAQQRATILSIGGMLVRVLSVLLLLPSSGSTGQNTTVGWILPASLLIAVTVTANFLMRRHRRSVVSEASV